MLTYTSSSDLDINESRVPSLSSTATLSSRHSSHGFVPKNQYMAHLPADNIEEGPAVLPVIDPYQGLLPIQLPHPDDYRVPLQIPMTLETPYAPTAPFTYNRLPSIWKSYHSLITAGLLHRSSLHTKYTEHSYSNASSNT